MSTVTERRFVYPTVVEVPRRGSAPASLHRTEPERRFGQRGRAFPR